MNHTKGVWILSQSEMLAANLKELLEMDGYPSLLFKDSRALIAHSKKDTYPQFLVLDELNNKDAYRDLLHFLPRGQPYPKIIVLGQDSDNSQYPLASSCLGLPLNLDNLSEVLKK